MQLFPTEFWKEAAGLTRRVRRTHIGLWLNMVQSEDCFWV